MANTFAERHDSYTIRSRAEKQAARSGTVKGRIERLLTKQIKNWKLANPGQEFVLLSKLDKKAIKQSARREAKASQSVPILQHT